MLWHLTAAGLATAAAGPQSPQHVVEEYHPQAKSIICDEGSSCYSFGLGAVQATFAFLETSTMTTENTPLDKRSSDGIDRRTAIKKAAVAAAAAGAVWNAPTIKGLHLRPAYAAAQSATCDDLRIADFRDVPFNTFTLQIQNDSAVSVTATATIKNRPYGVIPALVLPPGTTHSAVPATTGTLSLIHISEPTRPY